MSGENSQASVKAPAEAPVETAAGAPPTSASSCDGT